MTPQQRLKTWKLHDSQRGVFAYELYKHMAENEDIYLLCGDLGFPMFNPHQEDFPDRYLNTGASEASLLDICVGLSYAGKTPVAYSITTFLLYRAFETIRTYINRENLNVKLIASGRDFDYQHDGWSHHSPDDKLFMPHFENITSMWPENNDAVKESVDKMFSDKRPYYLNLTR